jgi:hypothetical protein
VKTGSEPLSRWYFRNVRFFPGLEPEGKVVNGSLQLNSNVSIAVERIGSGPLRMRIQALNKEGSVGQLYNDSDEVNETLSSRVILVADDVEGRAKNGQRFVFPFAGGLDLDGASGFMGGAPYPIIRSGKVLLLGRTLLGSSHYEAGSVALEEGDSLRFIRCSGSAVGFIIVDDRPAITAVYRIVASKGNVSRFGSQGYDIGTSLAARIKNDGSVQLVWACFLFLLGLFGLKPTLTMKEEQG